MKKLLLATTAIVALGAGAASAADMAVKARPLPPPLPACAQFGGFYVGAHVGAAYYRSERHDLDYWWHGSTDVATESGIIGGVQAGWNWQARCTVFGFEIDASWGSQDAHFRYSPNEPNYDAYHDRELKWFGTARTRAGVVVDNLLLYVTGGFAWANVESKVHYTYVPTPWTYIDHSDSKTRWGFVAGVGTEWAWGGGWTLKSEFLYMQFADHEFDVNYRNCCSGSSFDPNRIKADDSAWVARVGINYIFGGVGKAPLGKGPVAVAAKY
jgi:outer membrane immunogenic protein